MFAWTTFGSLLLVNLLFNLVYHCKARNPAPGALSEYVQTYSLYKGIFTLLMFTVGFAVYWVYSMTMWKDLRDSPNSSCLTGYNKVDFVNWILTLVFTTIPALLTLFLCVCCCPCISIGLCALAQERREQGYRRDQ